jgi:Tfp pilus assembly protein PilP
MKIKIKIKMRFVLLALLLMGLFLKLDYAFTSTKEENNLQFSVPSVFIYDTKGRRDPFISLVVKVVEEEKVEPEPGEAEPEELPMSILEESEYVLLGLIWDEEKVLALVKTTTGKWIVGKGSFVDEFLVSEINKEKEEVVLVGEKEIIKLRIRK